MKVKIFSEDYRDGLEADWPAIPRVGEYVSFDHKGGTDNLKVEDVLWAVGTDGSFEHVEIRLAF